MSVNRFADALRHGMELSEALEKGEPEYRFVRGKGWVPCFEPIEIKGVKETELRPGDVVIGWVLRGNEVINGLKYHITEIDGRWIRSKETRTLHEICGSNITFTVLR